MFKAIIFDKDGILADTENIHFETHYKALAEQGLIISKQEYAKYGAGTNKRNFHESISKARNHKIDIDKSTDKKQRLFKENGSLTYSVGNLWYKA